MEFLADVLEAVAAQFGSHCETVLHDLTQTYDHTIVAINNGHVTGRKVGDCGSNLGLEVLRGTDRKGNRFGYITHTPDGKIIRSSTVYIRNAKNKAVGALCINLDISSLMMADRLLKEFFNLNGGADVQTLQPPPEGGEVFASDVNQLLDALFKNSLAEIGKPVSMMTREDKIRAIAYLDARGAFLISKAGQKACAFFNISKYTLYSYLEAIHESEKTNPPESAAPAKQRRNRRAGKT